MYPTEHLLLFNFRCLPQSVQRGSTRTVHLPMVIAMASVMGPMQSFDGMKSLSLTSRRKSTTAGTG